MDTLPREHDDRKTLAPALINTIRFTRTLHEKIAGLREALHVSLELLAEKDAEIDRLRERNSQLTIAIRATVSDRTQVRGSTKQVAA